MEEIAKYETPSPGMTDEPCPFCGSTDSIRSTLCVDEGTDLIPAGEIGEIDTVHCRRCLSEAPVKVWNDRPEDPMLAKVRRMRALQIEYFRTRDQEILRQSKAAERELDQLLKGFEQNDLFYQAGQ